MLFSSEIIKQKLQEPLPGLASHLKLAPENRATDIANYQNGHIEAKKSAVMILLFPEGKSQKVILIRRAMYVGIHAGQIAFPGGRYEESDKNVRTTALREVNEEIGISPEEIEILGQLTDIYVPPSNFLISIFVGYLQSRPEYKIDEREVEEVIELNLGDFFVDDIILEKEFVVTSDNLAINALYYKVGNVDLWGASAMVMTELIDVLKTA